MPRSVIKTLQPLKTKITSRVRTIPAPMRNNLSPQRAVDATRPPSKKKMMMMRPWVYHKALDTIDRNNPSPRSAVDALRPSLRKKTMMRCWIYHKALDTMDIGIMSRYQ